MRQLRGLRWRCRKVESKCRRQARVGNRIGSIPQHKQCHRTPRVQRAVTGEGKSRRCANENYAVLVMKAGFGEHGKELVDTRSTQVRLEGFSAESDEESSTCGGAAQSRHNSECVFPQRIVSLPLPPGAIRQGRLRTVRVRRKPVGPRAKCTSRSAGTKRGIRSSCVRKPRKM